MAAKKKKSEGLEGLIKEELADGKSLQEIRTDLIKKGFDEQEVTVFTNKYFFRNYLVQSMFLVFFLAILPLIFMSTPSYTGYITAKQAESGQGSLLFLIPLWVIILMISAFLYLKSKYGK